MRFMPNSSKNNCTCDELHICNFCSNTYNIVMNNKDQNMNNNEESINEQIKINERIAKIREIMKKYSEIQRELSRIPESEINLLVDQKLMIDFIKLERARYSVSLAEAKNNYLERLEHKYKYPIEICIEQGSTLFAKNRDQLVEMTTFNGKRIAYRVIEENITLDKAPRGYMWVIYDNDTQTTVVDGIECSQDVTNILPTLAGGNYNLFCIPMGMEVVKTTSFKENVSDISFTVQDKKEEWESIQDSKPLGAADFE